MNRRTNLINLLAVTASLSILIFYSLSDAMVRWQVNDDPKRKIEKDSVRYSKESLNASLASIQKRVRKINKMLMTFDWFYSDDLPNMSGEMAFFFEGNSNRKLIFSANKNKRREIYEYYFIGNLIYVIKMTTTSKKPIYESGYYFKEYDKMDKQTQAKYFFINGSLVKWIGKNNDVNDMPDSKLIKEGALLLKQKKLLIDAVEIDY